jgi:tetratricopeptide (TPR) repeat protein
MRRSRIIRTVLYCWPHPGRKGRVVIGLAKMVSCLHSLAHCRTIAVIILLLSSRSFAQLSQRSLPDDPVAVGVQALKAGDLDTAQDFLSQALKQGIKHPIVFHNLGVIAQERRNDAQAVVWFRKSLVMDPNYGPSHLLLGSSLLSLGKREDAVRELKRAVRLMPQEPAAHMQLAKAYEATENWILAVDELQKLTALAPDNAEYAYQFAKALAKLSGWSIQEISRVNPNSARLHQALGQEYAIQGKFDRALIAYQEAAQADPRLPEIHLGMGLILLQLKRFDDALAEIKQELALVPDSKMAADAKTRIEAEKAAAH